MEQSKKYQRARQVRARYGGISDMTLWRWIRNHGFPEPEYINNQRFWDEEQLDEYDRRRTSTSAAA
jgi:predicted DNA-binding transcriptional regulator AlpA